LRPAIHLLGVAAMAKILALLLLAFMALHLIRPLGWPGLKRRGDVWKIAVIALVALSLTAIAGHFEG